MFNEDGFDLSVCVDLLRVRLDKLMRLRDEHESFVEMTGEQVETLGVFDFEITSLIAGLAELEGGIYG